MGIDENGRVVQLPRFGDLNALAQMAPQVSPGCS
jgi:hypothetical protein